MLVSLDKVFNLVLTLYAVVLVDLESSSYGKKSGLNRGKKLRLGGALDRTGPILPPYTTVDLHFRSLFRSRYL
jgi:hypothetical protein